MTAETKLSPREVAARGEDWYERHLRPQVEATHLGEFLVVDVNTGEYEIGRDYIQPTERLLAKRPDAVLYALRVGYRSVGRIGGRYSVDGGLMSEIVRRIVVTAQPEKIILFGSRARGDARLDSDIDLLVVADDPQPRSLRASALYGVLSDILIPMDILVYRPEEIEEWRNVPQAFVSTAVREGSVLYENHG